MATKEQIVTQELNRLNPRSPRRFPEDRTHVTRHPLTPPRLYPRWRNLYGQLVVDHRVTLEQELQEIRTRHELRREYNRRIRVLIKSGPMSWQEAAHAINRTQVDEPDYRP
jgi:hypothetical protein